jgi:hypothetical protein
MGERGRTTETRQGKRRMWCMWEGKGISRCSRQREDCDDVFVTFVGHDGDEGGRRSQSHSEQGRASGEGEGDRMLPDRVATIIRPNVRSMQQRPG